MTIKKAAAFAAAACMVFTSFTPAYMRDEKAASAGEPVSAPISEYFLNLGTQNYIAVNKAENITVDGSGEDWKDYPGIEVTKTRTYMSNAEIDITVSVKTAWDDDNFYFYTEVSDSNYNPMAGGNYWQGDCLQLCLGLPEEKFGDEIGFSYDETAGKPYIILPSEISGKADLVQSGFAKDGNLLKYEMAIPWTVPFDEKPDLFKFCLLAADNDGLGREYVVMMETGIEELKQNTAFPYMVLLDDSIGGLAWINGSVSLNTGEKQDYSINILNLGEEKTQTVEVSELGYKEELVIPAESWMTIPAEFSSGNEPRTADMYVETDERPAIKSQ